jgi:UDP-N-acetylmuramoyl-tripeptide--D-alanyl-D-alanine ligase
LGRHAAELHREIGAFTGEQGVKFLIAVGPDAEAYAAGARSAGLENVVMAADADEARLALLGEMLEGDAVLVKGSHFMHLERLVAALAGEEPG